MTCWPSAPLTGVAAIILVAATAAAIELPGQGHDYEACMRLAREQPVDGMETALAWENRGGGTAARHCAAVALVGLGDFQAAGRGLESLAWDLPAETPNTVRARVLAQAGQAWLNAGRPDKAHAVLSAAVELAPRDPEVRIDRAISLAGMSRLQDAIIDLSAALIADKSSVEALVLRANAFRRTGRPDSALADIERALEFAPEHPAALLERGILRRLTGDEVGARADWQKLIALHPDRPSADAARRYLGHAKPAVSPAPGTAPTRR